MQHQTGAAFMLPSMSSQLSLVLPVTITRTPATEAAYLKRALGFAMRAARQLGLENPTPSEVASYAIECREVWSPATWYLHKAALMYRYGEMGSEAAQAAVEMLAGAPAPTKRPARSLNSSARRAKTFDDKALLAVLQLVRQSNSKYAPILSAWLQLGSELGLRPHEWTQCEVIEARESDLAPIGPSPTKKRRSSKLKPYLRITNAKNTNGRGTGQCRHLDLSACTSDFVAAVRWFSEEMRARKNAGEYRTTYEGCGKLLQQVNHELHKNEALKRNWIQLYSPRHRFASLAKGSLPLDDIAAMMGHSSDKTAVRSYGRRRHKAGALSVAPVSAETAAVQSHFKPFLGPNNDQMPAPGTQTRPT